MFLKKKITKNEVYWSIIETYRVGKEVKQRTIKNLGKTSNALNELKNSPQYSKFYEEINKFNNNSIQKKIPADNPIYNFSNEFTFKFLKVKKKCSDEELRLTHRSIETIIEMGLDYLKILSNKMENMTDEQNYLRLTYDFKYKEIEHIIQYLSSVIEYSKSCKVKKSDVGLDGIEALALLKK